MTRFSTYKTAAIVGVLALSLAGCGNADTAETGNGTEENSDQDSIVLYSGRDEELIQPLIDEFSEATDIEVEVRYGETAELAAQILEEGENSPADVFLAQDAGALGAVAQDGLFDPLPTELVEQVPELYRDTEDQWVGVSGRLRTLIYNTEQVSEDELPDSVEELTAPEYEGRVGIAPTNGSFQSFVTAFRVSEGEDAAAQWLEDMAANDPQYREGNGPIVSDVIDGTLDMGLVNHYYLYAQAEERGVEPEELPAANHIFGDGDVGALVNVAGTGVSNADDQAAIDLVEYFLSQDGQQYFVEETAEYPLIEGVEAPADLPALDELDTPDIDLNQLEDLQTTIDMIVDAGMAG